jgi:exosortase/archaeosortase
VTFIFVFLGLILAAFGHQEGARTVALLAIPVSILEGANVIRKLLLIPLWNRKKSA